MQENNLKKEFSKRDVQRMRNIITGKSGDKTHVQGGYEKKIEHYKEGDVWEEGGKQWTLKNGIKQSITKLDKFKKILHFPLTCPECGSALRPTEITKKIYSIHGTCLDCSIKKEAKLKLEGKYKEYEKNIINLNKNTSLEEFEQALESWLLEKDTYVTEAGDIENWSGGDKTKIYEELKEKISELKKTDIY